MKKYRIRYQNDNNIYELIIQTSNLLNEKLPNNIIEIKEYKEKRLDFRKKVLKEKDLNLVFYELNLMLQSNINISDALDILIKNKKNQNLIDFLKSIKYSLSNGKPIDKNLKEFKIDSLIISFLKISQDSGNLALNISSLSKLLNENIEIKKNFLKVIYYPIVLFVSFFISLITIFNFVIPNFRTFFSQIQNELPLGTKILLEIQEFFENYILFLISTIIITILLF